MVVEDESAGGRADVVVKMNGVVYVIELKVDKSAREALEQIKGKGYHEPFRGKEVYLVGISVSSKSGRVVKWALDQL
ncbi:hypothetical protein A4H02_01715 [Fervidobacterium thailandense]|uniref:PD-(D/E)XK nuclease superfamily protein n=1 Tax=Fervidobacterium thailandense TaxID=1008305 RepID=A0A1E3G402_9BACT|nr:hypothetical protein A4H02_01715 [Fervidobacterium thailandense]